MKLISLSLVAGFLGVRAQDQSMEYSVEHSDGIQVVHRGHVFFVPYPEEEDSRYDDKWDIHPYKPPSEIQCSQEVESQELGDEYREAHVEAMKRIRKIPPLIEKSVALAKEIVKQQETEYGALFARLTSRKIDNKNQRDRVDAIQFWFEKAERELQQIHEDFLENLNALLLVTRKKALSLSVSADNSDVPKSAHDLKETLKRFEADLKPVLTELVTSLSTFSQKVNNWYYEKLDEPYKAEKLKKDLAAKKNSSGSNSSHFGHHLFYGLPILMAICRLLL